MSHYAHFKEHSKGLTTKFLHPSSRLATPCNPTPTAGTRHYNAPGRAPRWKFNCPFKTLTTVYEHGGARTTRARGTAPMRRRRLFLRALYLAPFCCTGENRPTVEEENGNFMQETLAHPRRCPRTRGEIRPRKIPRKIRLE